VPLNLYWNRSNVAEVMKSGLAGFDVARVRPVRNPTSGLRCRVSRWSACNSIDLRNHRPSVFIADTVDDEPIFIITPAGCQTGDICCMFLGRSKVLVTRSSGSGFCHLLGVAVVSEQSSVLEDLSRFRHPGQAIRLFPEVQLAPAQLRQSI
jgi:hypothetical protein